VAAREVRFEGRPQAIEEHAAKVKNGLRSALAPSNPRAVEAHSNEAAHRALDEATRDNQALLTQPLVTHAGSVLGEVVDGGVEPLPPELVARAGDGGAVECSLERCENLVEFAVPKPSLLLVNPHLRFARARRTAARSTARPFVMPPSSAEPVLPRTVAPCGSASRPRRARAQRPGG